MLRHDISCKYLGNMGDGNCVIKCMLINFGAREIGCELHLLRKKGVVITILRSGGVKDDCETAHDAIQCSCLNILLSAAVNKVMR